MSTMWSIVLLFCQELALTAVRYRPLQTDYVDAVNPTTQKVRATNKIAVAQACWWAQLFGW